MSAAPQTLMSAPHASCTEECCATRAPTSTDECRATRADECSACFRRPRALMSAAPRRRSGTMSAAPRWRSESTDECCASPALRRHW
eukprot:4888061-Alexandrium_andersonii.AAC.1